MIKGTESILKKIGIKELNDMQVQTSDAINGNSNTVLISPTGSGKTLAFLLPLLNLLDPDLHEIQAIIVVPTRELAIQIEQVARDLGAGFKINAVYGGRSGSRDKIDLAHRPALLIGTPGRVADRLRRDNYPIEHIKTLVLDEFDKSLEIGFDNEMIQIIEDLSHLEKKVLTSATHGVKIPGFLKLESPKYLNFTDKVESKLATEVIWTKDKDKLESVDKLIRSLGDSLGVVFCTFKDGLARVAEALTAQGIDFVMFHGGMEQIDRERSLIKFRNGTVRLLLATDLAARGIDVPDIEYVIHYHLPTRAEEFTHRSGRTARMNKEGVSYVLQWTGEPLPTYVTTLNPTEQRIENLSINGELTQTDWVTLFISGGRKDKISKGDIAGLFMKQGGLTSDQLGTIELKQDCAFIAISRHKSDVANTLNNSRLKKKKVRIYEL